MCPMEKYISTSKNPREAKSLRFKTGVSRSFSASSARASARFAVPAPAPRAFWRFSAAPYPAYSTAAITASGATFPSTPMEFVSKLTEQAVTPGTFDTAFSTRALQAAQLIPVTVY